MSVRKEGPMRHLTVIARVVLGIVLVFLMSCGTGHDADEK
jgi:hypothetical protein